MSEFLRGLPPAALLDLASAIEARSLAAPVSAMQVRRLGLRAESASVASELQNLVDIGLGPAALVHFLRVVATERQSAQRAADRTELVWTGPEGRGARGRDTAVVVRELFASAQRSVLLSTYAIFQGRQVFEPLAKRMDEVPDLQVRMFVHVPHAYPNEKPETELLREFANVFRNEQWPGGKLPDLFYDPRSLASGPGPRAALHAKTIVVDDTRAFVTSANFTEAAHERNIEAGVLVESVSFASSLRQQFEFLVERGLLRRLPTG